MGAFAGIHLIVLLGGYLRQSGIENLFLVGSFGASAVLVYGAPLAEFSQPRNLVGGHFVSALVGVGVVAALGASSVWAGASAVSLAIAAMHLTRTLHPPGGATALIAVIGGEPVQRLGFAYALCPILVGGLLMLAVALAVNNLSANPKRHYPVYWF